MQTLQYKKDTSPTIATWSWPKLFRTPHEISIQKNITSTSEAQELQSTRPKTASPKGKLRNQGTLRLGDEKKHLRMVSWHLKTSSFQRWLDDWVPRDGGLLIINRINTPYIAQNIRSPLIINPLINPYRTVDSYLFLPLKNAQHPTPTMAEWPSSHGSRLATFDAASKLRAGQETGGRGFPKGVVGEMGLGVMDREMWGDGGKFVCLNMLKW